MNDSDNQITRLDAPIFIGTSGWSYEHWKGCFYPEAVRSKDFLSYYAERFRTVEIDNTFYRLPKLDAVSRWRDAVPRGFLFSVKASRFITHVKKLRDPESSTKAFFDRIAPLSRCLGAILIQLPPHWTFNEARLAGFINGLPPQVRCAFEFRDHSWFNDRAFGLLERHGSAICIYDLEGFQSPDVVTADFVYVRLHGPASAYAGSYDEESLRKWAKRISAWSAAGRTVYCYFNNDIAGHAVENAARLESMLECA